MAERGVVVEIELAVEGQHVARGRDDQRVDLGQRGIGVDEQADEVLEERRALLRRVAREPERLADLPGLEVGQAEADVDRLAVDLLGRLLGDGLDLDAALGRGHQDRTLQGAIDGHAEVKLAGDVVADGHQHLGDELALRAGLVGHQRLAQQAGRGVLRLLGDRTSCTPLAIEAGRGLLSAGDLERLVAVSLRTDRHPLAAAAGVHLGLDHDQAAAQRRRTPWRRPPAGSPRSLRAPRRRHS